MKISFLLKSETRNHFFLVENQDFCRENFSEMDEIWTLFVSDIGEHFGHLRNTIGVIDLFLDDPAWKKPNTDENSENFPPEITVVIER